MLEIKQEFSFAPPGHARVTFAIESCNPTDNAATWIRVADFARLKLDGHLSFLFRGRLVGGVTPIESDVNLPCQRDIHLLH
jgi:hypothetical protein